MKSRHLFSASSIFLIAAVACIIMAWRPPNEGVRIPVHRANGKMGYIDDSGKMIIAGNLDSAEPFGPDGRALVTETREPSKIRMLFNRWIPSFRRFGYGGTTYYRIDRFGNKMPGVPPTITLPEWNALPDQSNEMTMVEQGGGFRWMLRDGSPAFPGTWQKSLDFQAADPAAVLKDGRWGFINRSGETVIPFLWDETHGFSGNGRACVAIDRKWGVINRKGDLIVPLYFKSLGGFDVKNMCSAQLASGWGFIDPKGKIKIPFRYRKAGNFDRFDMAKIEISDPQGNVRRGWINRVGEFVVQPLYHLEYPVWASNFIDHELLPVVDSNGSGLIDRKGQTIVATARGELQPVGDPMVPGRFWIRTAPHRSVTAPPGSSRLPFEPACHDLTGKLIWSGEDMTLHQIFNICAALSGLIASTLFTMGLRQNRRAAHQG